MLLQNIASSIKEYKCVRTATKALQTLAKMCIGNYQNQRTAVRGKVVHSIISILHYGRFTKRGMVSVPPVVPQPRLTEESKVSVPPAVC